MSKFRLVVLAAAFTATTGLLAGCGGATGPLEDSVYRGSYSSTDQGGGWWDTFGPAGGEGNASITLDHKGRAVGTVFNGLGAGTVSGHVENDGNFEFEVAYPSGKQTVTGNLSHQKLPADLDGDGKQLEESEGIAGDFRVRSNGTEYTGGFGLIGGVR